MTLAEAKLFLLNGETFRLPRHGKPFAQIKVVAPVRKPIDGAALKAFTDTLTHSDASAADLVRQMRDDARY